MNPEELVKTRDEQYMEVTKSKFMHDYFKVMPMLNPDLLRRRGDLETLHLGEIYSSVYVGKI